MAASYLKQVENILKEYSFDLNKYKLVRKENCKAEFRGWEFTFENIGYPDHAIEIQIDVFKGKIAYYQIHLR